MRIRIASFVVAGCLVLMGAAGVPATAPSAATQASNPTTNPATQRLLAFLIQQNESSMEKIRSRSYTTEIEWQRASSDGKEVPALKSSAEVKKKGDYLWSVYRQELVNQGTGRVEVKEVRVVVNDKYTAAWSRGNRIAEQFLHSSFDTISSGVRTRIAIFTPYDFLCHSLGDGETHFHDLIPDTHHSPPIRYDVIESKDGAGQLVYQIRRFMTAMDDVSKPDKLWIIDPRKGFLATDVISYKRDGSIWITQAMKITEVVPGIWFPTEYEEKYHGEVREPTKVDAVTSWRTAKLTNVKVNEEFTKGQFELDALRLKEDMPDILVVRTGLDGRRASYVYLGQTLVPKRDVMRRQGAEDVAR